MSKNFAAIYASTNDSIALEQKFFLKAEVSRGTLIAPTGSDFIYTLGGGGIKFSRPVDTSPVRTGRHNTSVIEAKDVTTWSFPTFFMVDESLGAFSTAEVDQAWRTLMKSLLGKETVGGSSLVYDSSSAPDITFSLFENGDLWANQAPGCYVESSNWTFPGDGRSQAAWSGQGKTTYKLGIGKSTSNNSAGNTVTLVSGDGRKFNGPNVGGMVMIIKADGTTRSTDTPDGTPRNITAVSGDVVTLDGAVLADADGSGVGAPIYLCYYEPLTPTAIDHPLIGLVGTVSIGGMSGGTCVRNVGINIQNNHEAHNFCWGTRGLSGPLYSPAGRLSVDTTVEMNLSHELVKFINNLTDFPGVSLDMTVGSASGRRIELALPKIPFSIPEVTVPENGSIPVTFTGKAEQTALDAADEITISVK